VDRRHLALLLPVLLTAHNVEEAVSISAFLPQVQARLSSMGLAGIEIPSYSDLLLGLLLVTVAGALVGLWVYWQPSSPSAIWALLLLQSVLFLNVFFHLASAAVLGGYAPGLITAVLLNLPMSLYVFRHVARERWLSRTALFALLPGALIVHGPLLVGLLASMS
jgi:hypothetical protein